MKEKTLSRLARTRRRRFVRRAVLAGVLVSLAVGGGTVVAWAARRPPPDVGSLGPRQATPAAAAAAMAAATASASGSAAWTGATPGLGSSGAKLTELRATAARQPVALVVAPIHVDAPVVPAGVDPADHSLDVPADAHTVVWWAGGARPGDTSGTVVLAAHVDYNGVPGVFARLATVPVGGIVTVRVAGGEARSYRVDVRRHVPKPALADGDVFRADGTPRLALITCGGPFDRAARSYKDNLVVLAVPV